LLKKSSTSFANSSPYKSLIIFMPKQNTTKPKASKTKRVVKKKISRPHPNSNKLDVALTKMEEKKYIINPIKRQKTSEKLELEVKLKVSKPSLNSDVSNALNETINTSSNVPPAKVCKTGESSKAAKKAVQKLVKAKAKPQQQKSRARAHK
jgi:hypothetical protein